MRDEKILELFAVGKTAKAVGEELGVSPEYALTRAKEVLAQGDVFDTIEKRKLLIYQLKSLAARANDMLDTIAGDKSWAQGVAAITKLIETTYNIQIKEQEQNAEEIEAATRTQAAILIQAIEMGYNRARNLLLAENPKLSLERADEVFQEGLSEVLTV